MYGDDCLSKIIVFEWLKRFSNGRGTLENEPTGRPISVPTSEMIQIVHDFIAEDRIASLRMMQDALNINEETIWTTLDEDFGKIKVYAKFVPHTINDD